MEMYQELSKKLGLLLKEHRQIMTTAESCTGGGVAMTITEIAGSSEWFDRAFVTYSNEAKQEMLGVQKTTLDEYGAVSESTVIEMAAGALARSNATISVSISGIAGPGGGSDEKPVGTVCFGWDSEAGWKRVETMHFSGDRTQVRSQAVYHALKIVHDYLISMS